LLLLKVITLQFLTFCYEQALADNRLQSLGLKVVVQLSFFVLCYPFPQLLSRRILA